MCDCYNHKCKNPKCDEIMPIHIADFCTPRENVEVFCPRHTPKNFTGYVYKLTKQEDYLPKGYRIGIRIKDVSQVQKGYSIKNAATPNLCNCELTED